VLDDVVRLAVDAVLAFRIDPCFLTDTLFLLGDSTPLTRGRFECAEKALLVSFECDRGKGWKAEEGVAAAEVASHIPTLSDMLRGVPPKLEPEREVLEICKEAMLDPLATARSVVSKSFMRFISWDIIASFSSKRLDIEASCSLSCVFSVSRVELKAEFDSRTLRDALP